MRTLRLTAAAIVVVVCASVLLATPANAVKATPEGHKHISVSQKNGKIVVKWLPTLGVKYFLVRTSITPDMSQDLKTYRVSKSTTTVTVAPTKYAGPGTGNYTFVRVYAVKKGKIGVSPYRRVRMDAPAPTVSTAETVATYNVRTAIAPEVPGHTWAERIGSVASQIQQSNAAVVAIQEAGKLVSRTFTVTRVGKTKVKTVTTDWQFDQLQRAIGGNYRVAGEEDYSATYSSAVREGTRILYDASKVTLIDEGNFAPSAVDSKLRIIPWAKFQDNVTGKQFYFISVHLAELNDYPNPATVFALRIAQVKNVISVVKRFSATGVQVIVAGDMNSNLYSTPYNAADQLFVKAGFFDAYATASNINEFYATFDDFTKPKSSGSRTDYILTYGSQPGSFSYKNWIVKGGVIPSDHFMQTATVPVY
jgi:endonuclease/exonuclease/phosphatase family metal-dependent hydrolase